MKKPVLIVLGLLLLAVISTYFIIPQNISVTGISHIDATDANVFKFIVKKNAWPKWWPGDHNPADSNLFAYNGMTYTLQNSTNSYIDVLIQTDKLELNSRITYLATGEGVSDVNWTAQKQSSLNPFARLAQYIRIKQQGKDIDSLLAHFKTFIQTDSNVYGIKVKLEKVTDPILLASNTTSTNYPATPAIYNIIANLRQQIKAQGATETNKPMINISKTDDNEYQLMVAIPVNKLISPAKGAVINKMVDGANLLATEVKGGRNTIDNAFVQLKNYQKDHRLISPAMPFELIVTDRLAEPDTTKWVTKVYWPVF